MSKFKNIRIKKRGGGSRTQRVQVLASGKYKFVKNVGSRSTKTKTSRKTRSKPKRRYRNMPRRKKRRRGRRKIPLLATMGAIGSISTGSSWSGGNSVLSRLLEGNINDAAKIAQMHFLGIDPYDGQWKPQNMVGTMSLVLGAGLSMLASKFGLNRYLKGIPLVKL